MTMEQQLAGEAVLQPQADPAEQQTTVLNLPSPRQQQRQQQSSSGPTTTLRSNQDSRVLKLKGL
jgi:hypothetical protein